MTKIANRVQIISHFDRNVKLSLVRFGPKKFGHVCNQTSKRLFTTASTRLDAAVNVASRYSTSQSYADCAFVNPKRIAAVAGIDAAIDFLLSAGFVRVVVINNQRTVETVQHWGIIENQ